ncbi:hypothetical protein Tco_1445658 [Tanacetum coccineum]
MPATTPLIGFSGEIIWPIGQIQLLTRSHTITSGSVDSSRNAKAPGGRGLITLKSSKMVPLECATVFRPEGNLPATKQEVEERVKVAINPEYLKQTIMICSTLTQEGRNKLCDLLQRNLDIFA